MAWVRVVVPGAAPPELMVRVNGDVLRSPLYGVEQLVNAGALSVVAAMPSAATPLWQHAERLSAGEHRTVAVALLAEAEPAVAPPVSDVVAAPPRASVVVDAPQAIEGGGARRTLAWVSGAAGLALIATGVVSGVVFQGTRESYDGERCSELSSPPAACGERYSTLNTMNTLQWVGYLGGGALLATGVVLLLTAPTRRSAPSVGVALMPDGGFGLSYGARF